MCPLPENQDIRDDEDRRLMFGIRDDNASDFEALYRRYYVLLCQFAFRFVKKQAEAEDIVHNVFLKVWENRTKWNPKGTLRAYLYRSVKNQALKCLAHRKVQNECWLEDPSTLPDHDRVNPEEKYQGKEFEDSVRKAIQRLPERRRMIWLMHREDKLTYREIAEILDLSIKTIETQMSRSLKFLRAQLAEFLPVIAGIIVMLHR